VKKSLSFLVAFSLIALTGLAQQPTPGRRKLNRRRKTQPRPIERLFWKTLLPSSWFLAKPSHPLTQR